MTQRRVRVNDVGEVWLAKQRRSANMRLSVTASGQVRLSLPWWLPYETGLIFVNNQKAWIQQQLSQRKQILLREGALVGKAHHLHFHKIEQNNSGIRTSVSSTDIDIRSSLPSEHKLVQAAAHQACERALRKEATQLLPQRLKLLAAKYNFEYEAVKVRKMTSRWGSCSRRKTITLSYFLVQLPWPLIDYVLLHELMHTRYLHHGKAFWRSLEQIMPQAREIQKLTRDHKPQLQPL